MAAITNLNQLVGETARIQWLHQASQPNPLNILLLSDGFVDADRDKFKGFLENLRDRFFRIAPFNYCKSYINILYWFGESLCRGIGPERPWDSIPPSEDWRTIFISYILSTPAAHCCHHRNHNEISKVQDSGRWSRYA